jgi:hypothetical protein
MSWRSLVLVIATSTSEPSYRYFTVPVYMYGVFGSAAAYPSSNGVEFIAPGAVLPGHFCHANTATNACEQ